MANEIKKPDYIFEVSWEICNKVGGINTVIATKSLKLVEEFKDKLILIGPDVWRETVENPAFEEDQNLFKAWKQHAIEEGLRVRIGTWNIVGKPIVILIDSSSFIQMKNEVFKKMWELYRLDSLSGSHDYVEAAMFGYAAGRVIESFWNFYLSLRDTVTAHFHEWMSGLGVLYLKDKTPQIGTLFTTHATAVGRSIAGNNLPLYKYLDTYNGDEKSKELGLTSKHSLEKLSAQNADCFTTVSEITAKECKQLLQKKVDIVTPNGFEDSFVPQGEEFDKKKQIAHQKLMQVAEATLGYKLPADTLFVANSGRYEYKNKGIDVFIKAIAELNKPINSPKKTVVAFILVPANNYGARRDLQAKLYGPDKDIKLEKSYLTHGLHDSEYDQILNEIRHQKITNDKTDKAKIIFVPSYLNGNDGIFNLSYYDLLIGLDITVFPSYYEPWGYTPLESLAFYVPTITTDLAGIGMWVNKELVKMSGGIDVIERSKISEAELIKNIVKRLTEYSSYNEQEVSEARKNAFEISRIALWDNLIQYYHKAYDIALNKIQDRSDRFDEVVHQEHIITRKISKSNKPIWNTLLIEANLPQKFLGLDELSKNLWWCWNYEAVELFRDIDPVLWEQKNHNPIELLKAVSIERYAELDEDKDFIEKYDLVYKKYIDYLGQKPDPAKPSVSYFSMEYGIDTILKIYSGGLGILAGDYLKEASDSNVDMVGIGLLYKYGYFTQQLSVNGEQLVSYEPQNFSNLPIVPEKDEKGDFVTVKIAFPGRMVYAKIWHVKVGRIKLYLLDTDFDLNRPEDMGLTHQLYGGDHEHRLKQEILLGVGGIRALKSLGIDNDVYHCNEGHAAFIGFERMRHMITENNYTFDEAMEIVRSSSLFTTHTPVPAGHDAFDQDLIMMYMGHYPERLKTSWERFINLGMMNPENEHDKFSMSALAANLSQEMNGVSMLHGEVTKSMFNQMWEGYYQEELHVGYVTNGVHYPTWIAKEWKQLYDKEFNKEYILDQSNKEHWNKIHEVEDEKIWEIRQKLRKVLIDEIKTRLSSNWVSRHVNPKRIVGVRTKLSPKTLTIGFARRFATYKRAHLLFKDLDRLSKIVNNPERPVQFVFAGKAHPADGGGQGLIKYVVEVSNRPEFLGKILFLQDYNINLAKKLVQGVDIWMNTPTRPLEASGTSGMKAVLNGVLNFSVLDGWWVEGYKEGAGWALPLERTYDNQDFQDELDAETIYTMLEEEIAPLFYDKNENGIPVNWIKFMKKNIAEIAPEFTTKRMIDDYMNKFYIKLNHSKNAIKENDFELAKSISAWKKKISRGWQSIELVSKNFPDFTKKPLTLGENFVGEVVLDLNELSDLSIGVELLITDNQPNKKFEIIDKIEMKLMQKDGALAYYQVNILPPVPGAFNYGIRMFPKNESIRHRQDFAFIRWL